MTFVTIHIFCGGFKARSDCTYIQADLALHPPLLYIILVIQTKFSANKIEGIHWCNRRLLELSKDKGYKAVD